MVAGKKPLFFGLTSLLLVPILADQRAFADGFFSHNLQAALASFKFNNVPLMGGGLLSHNIPASIGDREASLFIQINPPILTSETQEDAYLEMRLYDARTGETIRFTTFIIEVTHGTDPNARPLLTDVFHTESGLLTLRIQPQEGPLQVFGTQEDFLNAWKADPGGTINLRGPILLEAGLYRINVDLLTVDSIRTMFPPGEEPSFEAYLSVGDVYHEDVQVGGQTFPTTVISYYDRIVDFNFEPETLTYSWSMPFVWDLEAIRDADAIFVHEEIIVPKSFEGMGDATSFDASVNGVPLAGRMLTLDPFSSEENLIVHFLINKNDLLNIGQQIEASDTMDFVLSPSSNGARQTSDEITTDTGGVLVMIDWTPGQLAADSESLLDLEFRDAYTADILEGDVTYNLRVLDDHGNEVHSIRDQVSEESRGSHLLTFPADESYNIEVEVTSVIVDGQEPDLTRSGIARGIVIVPEFPAGAVLAVAGALASIIAFQRLVRKEAQGSLNGGLEL